MSLGSRGAVGDFVIAGAHPQCEVFREFIGDWILTSNPVGRDALKNDLFFKHYKPWQKAMEMLIEMGVRAEQQALAKWGLNYVIDEYLPQKLKQAARFLP